MIRLPQNYRTMSPDARDRFLQMMIDDFQNEVDTIKKTFIRNSVVDANTVIGGLIDNTPVALTVTQLSTLLSTITTGAGLVPVGTIQTYIGSAAPTGWILANASTPKVIGISSGDYQGSAYLALYTILWDSAGTTDAYSHKISSAKGASAAADWAAAKTIALDYRGAVLRVDGTSTGFTENTLASAGVGVKQDDSFQGHWHYIRDTGVAPTSNLGITATDNGSGGASGTWTTGGTLRAHNTLTDGTNGTPRVDKESRMKNIGVNLIIKY